MLALSFDRSLATAVAARPEDDEALQRKLWLAIARHLISAAAAAPDADAVCFTSLRQDASACMLLLAAWHMRSDARTCQVNTGYVSNMCPGHVPTCR